MNLVAYVDELWGCSTVRIYDLHMGPIPSGCSTGLGESDPSTLLTLGAPPGCSLEPDNTYYSSRSEEQVATRKMIVRTLENWDEHGNRRRMRIDETVVALEEMGIKVLRHEGGEDCRTSLIL